MAAASTALSVLFFLLRAGQVTALGLAHVKYSRSSTLYPLTSAGNRGRFQGPTCFSSANISALTTSEISLSDVVSMEPQKAMKTFKCKALNKETQ